MKSLKFFLFSLSLTFCAQAFAIGSIEIRGVNSKMTIFIRHAVSEGSCVYGYESADVGVKTRIIICNYGSRQELRLFNLQGVELSRQSITSAEFFKLLAIFSGDVSSRCTVQIEIDRAEFDIISVIYNVHEGCRDPFAQLRQDNNFG